MVIKALIVDYIILHIAGKNIAYTFIHILVAEWLVKLYLLDFAVLEEVRV